MAKGFCFSLSMCELYLESPGGLCCGYVDVMAVTTAADQPGERLHYVTLWLCYGHLLVRLGYVMLRAATRRCVSQERIKVSAVPTAPCIFFQPLSSGLAYSGFKE